MLKFPWRIAIRRMATSAEDVQIVQENVQEIIRSVDQARIASLATDRCLLVAVSKTKPSELIKACYDIGQRHFGENYVQELEEKSEALVDQCPEIKWHFIGQIQSNKIGKIAKSPSLFCVETIESEKQCQMFDKEMSKLEKNLNVLIQVNTSGEDQKGGVKPEDAPALALFIHEYCPHLKFSGFMTIGSFDNSHTVPNPDFDCLLNVRKEWAKITGRSENEVELSMGMSDDYLVAIQQGSTSVRVGSKIFGPRLYKK